MTALTEVLRARVTELEADLALANRSLEQLAQDRSIERQRVATAEAKVEHQKRRLRQLEASANTRRKGGNRDRFEAAKAAMAALIGLSNDELPSAVDDDLLNATTGSWSVRCATQAVRHADALLAELAKTSEQAL